MAQNSDYQGPFGGTPPEGTPKRGQSAEDARKALQKPPETKAVQAPPETK